jgi:hypothetical protein
LYERTAVSSTTTTTASRSLATLTPAEQELLQNFRAQQSTSHTPATYHQHTSDWNDSPNYSLQQLNAFTQHQWNDLIFTPFVVLTQHQSLGIALRFLAFVPLVPSHVTIPRTIKDLCHSLGIGETLIQVTTFFMRDLAYLHDNFPPLRENELRHNTAAINVYEDKRIQYHNTLMRRYRH